MSHSCTAHPYVCAAAASALQSASVYTAAGAASATVVYAGSTSASATPSVVPSSTITPSTSSSTAANAQTNVESGGGGPDYDGAYANNFTAADVAANPTAGTVATAAVTITAAGSTVIAFDTVLNPAVVYGGMASVNTTSARTIAVGSGSFAAVCEHSRPTHHGLVTFVCLSTSSIQSCNSCSDCHLSTHCIKA